MPGTAHGLYGGPRNTMQSAACLKMQLTAQCALGLTEKSYAAKKGHSSFHARRMTH